MREQWLEIPARSLFVDGISTVAFCLSAEIFIGKGCGVHEKKLGTGDHLKRRKSNVW
jgi:hypothetical protein